MIETTSAALEGLSMVDDGRLRRQVPCGDAMVITAGPVIDYAMFAGDSRYRAIRRERLATVEIAMVSSSKPVQAGWREGFRDDPGWGGSGKNHREGK